MLKYALLCLLLLTPLVMGSSCNKGNLHKSGTNYLGVVELGPFPKQGPGVGGYNLYLGQKKEGPFEKINDEPVLGYTKLMVPMLNPGQVYFFRMTSVSQRDPSKESVPGGVFKRTAASKGN